MELRPVDYQAALRLIDVLPLDDVTVLGRAVPEGAKLRRYRQVHVLAVEGELPEDRLAAFGDDGEDLMMALARRIISGEEDGDEAVEEALARAQDAVS